MTTCSSSGWSLRGWFGGCVELVVLVCATTLPASAQSYDERTLPTALFTAVTAGRGVTPEVGQPQAGELRRRLVDVDYTGLGGKYGALPAHRRLELTLFQGNSYTAVLDRLETTYSGRS